MLQGKTEREGEYWATAIFNRHWAAALFNSMVKYGFSVKANLSRHLKVRWNVVCLFQLLVYFFVVEQHSLIRVCYRFSGGHFIIIRALMLLMFSSISVCCPSSSGKILRTLECHLMCFRKIWQSYLYLKHHGCHREVIVWRYRIEI